jgi:heme exporter protein B
MSLTRAFAVVFRRDVRLAWAAGGGAAAPVGFFAGAVTLLPLAIGADADVLARIGPGLLWIIAALAALMTLERLFQADLEDGSLDQLLLSQTPLELIVLAKAAALWVAIGLPLALVAMPLAVMLQIPPAAAPLIAVQLSLGMAAFIGFGLVGAAVSAGVRRGGVLIAVLVLPFFAPPIIFGAAAAQALAAGEPTAAGLLLSGVALAALAIGPIAAAAALRLQAE